MHSQTRNDAARNLVICVDSYAQGNPQGCYFNGCDEEDVFEFQSLTQLIVGIENNLDAANFPQSFTAVRSFSVKPEPELKSVKKRRRGKLATFSVKILFRQNTSWQGSITWQEKKSEQTFRSVLELILLMDSALNTTSKPHNKTSKGTDKDN